MTNPVTRWLSLMWHEHVERPYFMILLGAVILVIDACLMAVRGDWGWLVPVLVFSTAVMAFCGGILMERYTPGSYSYRRGFLDGMAAWRGHEQDKEMQ